MPLSANPRQFFVEEMQRREFQTRKEGIVVFAKRLENGARFSIYRGVSLVAAAESSAWQIKIDAGLYVEEAGNILNEWNADRRHRAGHRKTLKLHLFTIHRLGDGRRNARWDDAVQSELSDMLGRVSTFSDVFTIKQVEKQFRFFVDCDWKTYGDIENANIEFKLIQGIVLRDLKAFEFPDDQALQEMYRAKLRGEPVLVQNFLSWWAPNKDRLLNSAAGA